MPSSRRVIKSSYAVNDLQESLIHTNYEVFTQLEEETSVEAIDETEELLKEAQNQAEALLLEAQKEAAAIKAQAEEMGFSEGEKAGFEQGLENGFNEGMKQAEAAFQEQENHLREMVKQANEQLNTYQETVKEQLLSFSVKMAEKITHQQIDASELGVLEIAKPYFYQLDKNEELVILTVHPEALEKVNQHLHKVEELVPESRVIALSNPSLEKNGLIVETSKGVADFQIHQQLDNMVKEFMEMERTIDG